MASYEDDGSFINRRECSDEEKSLLQSAGKIIPSHMPTDNCRINKDSMTRIIKYVLRLNYQHFSQFSTPLTMMSSEEFKAIKQTFNLEINERWTAEMLHPINGRRTSTIPAGKNCIAEE